MNDLISRQKAIESMASAIWLYPNELHKNLNVYENAEKLAKYGLERVPSIEPRKGRWERDKNGYVICSECKWFAPTIEVGNIANRHKEQRESDFCWHCGADMRGSEQ